MTYTQENFVKAVSELRSESQELSVPVLKFIDFTEGYFQSEEDRKTHLGNRLLQERHAAKARRDEDLKRIESLSETAARLTQEVAKERQNRESRHEQDAAQISVMEKKLKDCDSILEENNTLSQEKGVLTQKVTDLTQKTVSLNHQLAELKAEVQALTPEKVSVETQTDILQSPSTFLGWNSTQWVSFNVGLFGSAALMEATGHVYGHSIKPYSYCFKKGKQGLKKVFGKTKMRVPDTMKPTISPMEQCDTHIGVPVSPVPTVPVVQVHN